MASKMTTGISIPVIGFCLMVFVTFFRPSNANLTNLQKFADIELKLVQAFREYLELQQQEINDYRKFVEHVKMHHELAFDEAEDVVDYLGNPINAFTLIKRMVIDWNHLHGQVQEGDARKFFLDKLIEAGQLPDNQDLRKAAKDLANIQKVYYINTTNCATEHGSSFQLAWQDCFEYASNLYDEKEFSLAITWFEEALRQLKRKPFKSKNQNILNNIYEYLALSYYETGEFDVALEYIDDILKLEPRHVVKETKFYMLLNMSE